MLCGVRLPDRVVAEAETVQDLADALLRENSGDSAGADGPTCGLHGAAARPAVISRSPAQIADLEEKIRSAESLTEIVRLRGIGEPAREHIHLYGEDEQLHTITFGELYSRASTVARELQARGLEPGQTVAIMLPTCAEFFYTFAGVLSGRRDSRADLSASSGRPHHGIRDAAGEHPAERGIAISDHVPASRGSRATSATQRSNSARSPERGAASERDNAA